jgi:urea transporter
MVERAGAGGATGVATGLAATRVSAPHFLQNDPVTGAPQPLQNLVAAAAGGLGAITGCGIGAVVARVPHLLQNGPLTCAPHLLQKFAMVGPSAVIWRSHQTEGDRAPARPLRIVR